MANLEYAERLRRTVESASRILLSYSEEDAAHRPAPGKWSRKEIIGHLIDSASNNHQRFVRAQFQEDLIFTGYDQDKWVAAQDYQHADWNTLVELWRTFNLHIANVMENVPDVIRMKQHIRHNLHLLSWQPVPVEKPATLDYFMNDYVGHLEHHLRQAAAL